MAASRYTDEQLQQYFNHIQLPTALHHTASSIQSQSPSEQITFLNALIRHQLVHVPFENLDLHYAPVRGISLGTDFLFDKVVTRASGRGGYCMQNNAFFATVLRSVGFNVSSHGARICLQYLLETPPSPSGEENYIGWSHQINIVTINGARYFCDVGFGSTGATFLVPVEDGFTAINTGDEERVATSMRLHQGWTAITVNRNEDTKQWIYSIKYGPADSDKPWIQCYAFSKTEFFAADFEVMSWHVSTDPGSMFVNNVLAQKYIMSEDGERLIGDVTLFGKDIKERRYGTSQSLMEIKSEADRLEALERFLSITLKNDEKEGIVGHITQIKEE